MISPDIFTIHTTDRIELEARWSSPSDPDRCIVFCHPSPMHGGTMTAPLMSGVTRHLVASGYCVLRFNFRGVGRSTGASSGGQKEVDDVAAAVEAASLAFPELPIGIAGWSFGAATALNWQARDASSLSYVGIAPPVRSDNTAGLPAPTGLVEARRTFIVGDRDQFTTVEELTSYADSIDAKVEVVGGSDHFFFFRYEAVAALVAGGLG